MNKCIILPWRNSFNVYLSHHSFKSINCFPHQGFSLCYDLTYYIVTFLCRYVCSIPAVLNNTVTTAPLSAPVTGRQQEVLDRPAAISKYQRAVNAGSPAAPVASRSPQLMLINSEIHTSFSGLIWLDALLQTVIRAGPRICSLRVVDNGPQNAVTATQRRGSEQLL